MRRRDMMGFRRWFFMANVQKYTKAQIGGLTRHYERSKKENGEYQQFGNQEIDISKSHLNYNLAPERDGGQLTFINNRTSEVKCQNRSDVNVMCSWVITAPAGLASDIEYGADDKPRLSFDGNEDELKLFFQESYKFLNQRYANGGDKNVISAYVHMDEVTPHLHYAFVPVVHDERKNIDKVSAKIAIDRLDLQTFHQDLEQHMTKIFGRELGLLNNATKEGNKDVLQLKRESAIATAEKALLDELKPIEGKIAGEQTINKFTSEKVVEQKRFGALGEAGVFIPGVTKADVLKIAKAARQRLNDVKKANVRADAAVNEKNKTIELAEKEVKEQKQIAKTATEAWGETLNVLKEHGVTYSKRAVEVGNIPSVMKHYVSEAINQKKIADTVPFLQSKLVGSSQEIGITQQEKENRTVQEQRHKRMDAVISQQLQNDLILRAEQQIATEQEEKRRLARERNRFER